MPARWWESEPQAVCVACGGLTWSKSATPLHRKCRPRAAPRPSESWGERKRRKQAVEQHRAQYGEWCPGWRRPGHAVIPPNKLTADHIVSVAQGGPEDGPLQTLCRSCNSSKRRGSGVAGNLARNGEGAPSGWYSPSRAWSVATEYVPSGTC